MLPHKCRSNTYQGEWQGPALGGSLLAACSCWLSCSCAIFFERRLAAIGAFGDRLIAPSVSTFS